MANNTNQLSNEDVLDIAAFLKPYFRQGERNDFVMYLAGWLRKEGVAIESVYNVVEELAENDEEKQARFRTVEETYKKENLDGVCGYSGLHSILANQLQNEQKASQLLAEVKSLFPIQQGQEEHTTTANKIKSESVSQTLIKLAKANIKILFKDQYGNGYAYIYLKDHSETVSLDSIKFKHFLSKLYYDDTSRGKVANQESINDAIRVLYSETIFEGNTVPLNLRVAWGSNDNDTIHIDMTDDKWRHIEIRKEKWE